MNRPQNKAAHTTTVRNNVLELDSGLSRNELAVVVLAVCAAISIIAAVFIWVR